MISFTVNGQPAQVDVEAEKPLLWVLREDLNITDPSAGAVWRRAAWRCTVHIDGAAVRSCSMAASDVAGKTVITIEGLAPGTLHAVQKAWIEEQVPQCGYCQPGFIMSAVALLKANPKPTDQDIDEGPVQHLPLRHLQRHPPRRPSRLGLAGRRAVKKWTRRMAIIGGVAGGGLLGVGFWFARERDRLGDRTLLNVKPNEAGLSGWVKITRDNGVVVAVPRAEMGQGVQTALAMLVAEEMDARWNQVRVEDPPENGVYRNVDILIDGLPFSPEETGTVVDIAHWMAGKLGGVLGVLATGGSSSVRDAWHPMRVAGAVARDLLLRAASRKASVPVSELVVVDGEVRRKSGGRVATFGELVDHVGDLSSMPAPPLKKPSEFKLIGKPLPRLDIPAKVLATATFGIDVRRPGLLYAAVLNAPTFGGSATGFKVQGNLPKGVETVIIVPGGIAAIGTSWWRANKLLQEGIEVQWQPGPEPTLDSATPVAALRGADAGRQAGAGPHAGRGEEARGNAGQQCGRSRRPIARPISRTPRWSR